MSYHKNHENGFSLIECVVAIALLATVVGSMIAMQGTILRIIQFSNEKERASLELNSVMAQFEYVLNNKGFKGLPKPDESTEWKSTSGRYTDKVSSVKTEMKLSEFILSALNMYYLGDENQPNLDLFKPTFLIPLDANLAAKFLEPAMHTQGAVSWELAKATKSISEKIFLMNNEAIDAIPTPTFGTSGTSNPPNPPKPPPQTP